MKTKAEINQLAMSLKPTVEAAIIQCSDDTLSTKQVAVLLGISVAAVHIRCSRKKIPYNRKHGRLYFSKNEVTKYYLSN